MSGITGFVNFTNRAENQDNILNSMLMQLKYGDEIATTYSTYLAQLGMLHNPNKHLTSTDTDVYERHYQSEPICIVFDGTLYNEKEIQSQITDSGYSLTGLSTCETVLCAYKIWGIECFKRFDGAYALAIWDDTKQELILARDFIGIQPLYYYNTGDTICFGSTPKTILSHPQSKALVDTEGLCDILSFVKPPGNAIFHNMHEIIPGTALIVKNNSIVTHKYWSIELKEHRDSFDDTLDAIQQLLETSIERRLDHASIQLSGGLDSCTILGIASEISRKKNMENLQTFSAKWLGQYFPDGTPSDFNIEEANVIHMAQREHTTHKDIPVDVIQLLDDRIRGACINARDLPVGLGDMDMLYYLFYRGIKEHSSVTLSGEGADELFGGYFWFHDPKYVDSDTFAFHTVNQHWGTGDVSAASALISPHLLKKLNLEQYQRTCYTQAVSSIPLIASKDDMEQKMLEVCYLHLTHWSPILLDRRDRVSRSLGMEVHLPFCDKKLIEYVFNIPWSMKKFDENTKSLLRTIATRYIPKSVAYQGKSAWVANQPPGYEKELRKKLNSVLTSENSPVLELLDQKVVKELVSNPMAFPSFSAHAIGGVLRLNQWLETYHIEFSGI